MIIAGRPRAWSALALAVLAALWIAVPANWPLWRALARLPELASPRGVLFALAFCAVVAALLTAALAGFAWRETIKPAIALFVVCAAFNAHFAGAYGVIVDRTVAASVLQTHAAEALELATPELAASLALLAGPPLLLLARVRVRPVPFVRQCAINVAAAFGALMCASALAAALFADFSATLRNHKALRYMVGPFNVFYAFGAHALDAKALAPGPPQPIGAGAALAPLAAGMRPPLLALVVGETARADHFSLNGYARRTNAALERIGVVSFSEVTSCGTSTAASLPCMFSHLGREGFERRSGEHENLLDLAWRAGLAVLWVDNQAGCKGVCDRVPYVHASDPAPGTGAVPAGLCRDGECLDEALLHGLEARLAALPAERRARGVLLVLHQMGSHGPAYHRRSPPETKPFRPECETGALARCGRPAIVNAYDNSIAYTDRVLARTIGWLERQAQHYDPMLLYVSDHGESLGEGNVFLHGLPFAIAPREQTHVPMIAWLHPRTASARGVDLACLRKRRAASLSHDHLFHTVTGLLGIAADEYRPALDVVAACRAPG